MRKIRCRARCGDVFIWTIGQNKAGKWKAMSVGKPKGTLPIDFAPFEISNAVVNGPAFETQDEAETFVRSL